jgi:hypothetical protein
MQSGSARRPAYGQLGLLQVVGSSRQATNALKSLLSIARSGHMSAAQKATEPGVALMY